MKLVNKFSCNFYYFKIKKNIYFITKYLNQMKSINLFKTELAILWNDNSETILPYTALRRACPCAFCSGEQDVLGNQYGGENVVVDKKWYVSKMSEKMHLIKWEDAKQDVSRFLKVSDQEGLKVWSQDFFLELLEAISE